MAVYKQHPYYVYSLLSGYLDKLAEELGANSLRLTTGKLDEYMEHKFPDKYKEYSDKLLDYIATFYTGTLSLFPTSFWEESVRFKQKIFDNIRDEIIDKIKSELKDKNSVSVEVRFWATGCYCSWDIEVNGETVSEESKDLCIELGYEYLYKMLKGEEDFFIKHHLKYIFNQDDVKTIFAEYILPLFIYEISYYAYSERRVKPEHIIPSKPKLGIDGEVLKKYEEEIKSRYSGGDYDLRRPYATARTIAGAINFIYSNFVEDLIREGYSCKINDVYANYKTESPKEYKAKITIKVVCENKQTGKTKTLYFDYDLEIIP